MSSDTPQSIPSDIEPKLPLSICFSYPYGNGFDPAFLESITNLLIHEISKSKEERILGSILKMGSCYVDGNRSKLAIDFMNITQDDWLLMIDTDISFKPYILERLKAHIEANPTVQVIAGRVNLSNGLPVFYRLNRVTGKQVHQPFPFVGLAPFDLVGTGIICIRRDVFPILAEKDKHFHFFSKIIMPNGSQWGDDFSFCYRLNQVGIIPYGAWDIEGTHWKTMACANRYLEFDQLEIK